MKGACTLGDETISREVIANMYLSGAGIEIGALWNPLKVPKGGSVKYVDRLPVEGLRKHYPELKDHDLVHVDILDDGELLGTIGDATQDFVIANHFLEHCANPILAVDNMFRVLKVTGILYIALPDKRYCFDMPRPLTTFEHLMRDFKEGPGWSRRSHFEEWARLVNKIKGEDEVERHVKALMETNYSIHYHVFITDTMLEFFMGVRKILDRPFELEIFLKSGPEAIIILRRI